MRLREMLTVAHINNEPRTLTHKKRSLEVVALLPAKKFTLKNRIAKVDKGHNYVSARNKVGKMVVDTAPNCCFRSLVREQQADRNVKKAR